MDVGVKLFTLGVELNNTEALQGSIHDTLSHAHPLLNLVEVLAKLFDFLYIVDLDLVSEIITHLKVVANIKQVLSELSYSELSSRINFLLVSLDCVVILGKLVDQLFLVLLNLFLEDLNLLILFPNQLLDLLNVLFR